MPAWDETVLSTPASLARHEREVNALNAAGWEDKIDLARDFLKTRVELELKKAGCIADVASGESLIDLVQNTEVFNYASDYLALQLVFEDLANGREDTPWGWKMQRYRQKFEQEFLAAMQLLKFDLDNNGIPETPNLITQGRFVR